MRLECREHWNGHNVVLDAADAGNSFRRNPQRLLLLVRLVRGEPEMHDPVADDNVLRPDPCPFLAAKLGEKPAADCAVVGLFLTRWRTLCRPDRADDVCPADNPDKRA